MKNYTVANKDPTRHCEMRATKNYLIPSLDELDFAIQNVSLSFQARAQEIQGKEKILPQTFSQKQRI